MYQGACSHPLHISGCLYIVAYRTCLELGQVACQVSGPGLGSAVAGMVTGYNAGTGPDMVTDPSASAVRVN